MEKDKPTYQYIINDPINQEIRQVTTQDVITAIKVEEGLIKNEQVRTTILFDKVRAVTLAMSEIRFALNLPKVDKDQPGLGEHPKLTPLFEEDQVTELQTKYLTMSTVLTHMIDQKKQEVKTDP